MRKRYHNFDHRSGLAYRSNTHSEEPKLQGKIKDLRGQKKRKRSWLKFAVAALVLALIGIVVYEGATALSATNKILPSGISLKEILGGSSALKQTDQRTNILLLGKGGANHSGGQLTDTMLLLSIHNPDKKVAIISVPRDLQVTIPGHGVGKLNEAYANGFNDQKDQNKKDQSGADLTSKVFETVTGVPIHYHVTADFSGFKDLVDALGGVKVNVEKDLYDPYYPKDSFDKNGNFVESDAYQTVNIKAGVQMMDGSTALKYARSRETSSDFDRSARQQNLILAVKDKALSLGVLANPVKVTEMLNALGNHIKTDLTLPEIKELLDIVKNIDKSKVINEVIDNNPKDGLLVSTDQGGYYLLPKAGNFSQVQKTVKGIFDTTSTSVPDIEVYNASGVAGAGTKFAGLLKADGLTITKIETNPKVQNKSEIVDSSANQAILSKIKALLKSPTLTASTDKTVIKVILGLDYGK